MFHPRLIYLALCSLHLRSSKHLLNVIVRHVNSLVSSLAAQPLNFASAHLDHPPLVISALEFGFLACLAILEFIRFLRSLLWQLCLYFIKCVY